MTDQLPPSMREYVVQRTLGPELATDDAGDAMLRQSVRTWVLHLLELLGSSLAPGEELRDLHLRHRARQGPRGTKIGASMLVLTDRRILVVRGDQIDDIPPSVMEVAYGGVEIRPKRLQVGVEVVVEGGHVAVEVNKGQADELQASLTTPPPTVAWITEALALAAAAVPAATSASPAGWHADPSGRHEHRYWDGSTWTAHVSDGGVQTSDPLG